MNSASAPHSVDVVVPVHNEQGTLPASIRRLHDYLSSSAGFAWRIVIADNGSTDETPRVSMALAEDLPGVELLALGDKGRGRALRAAWERTEADVVCYMDVDRSAPRRSATSKPSMSGSITSRIITCGRKLSTAASASWPVAADAASKPW